MNLAVAERFVSINGEGLQAGRLATFIRFCGCNLHCAYCDTRWACEPCFKGEHIDIDCLVDYVVDAGCVCVTLTGGEPLLQPALPQFVKRLLGMKTTDNRAFEIEIETNGALSLETLAHLRQSVPKPCQTPYDQTSNDARGYVSFTMDWKCPSSGMTDYMLHENLAYLTKRDTIKFVVGTQDDLECARRLVQDNNLTVQTNVLLSPVFGGIEPKEIVEYMKRYDLVDVRFQLQLHKFIWPPTQRGV